MVDTVNIRICVQPEIDVTLDFQFIFILILAITLSDLFFFNPFSSKMSHSTGFTGLKLASLLAWRPLNI